MTIIDQIKDCINNRFENMQYKSKYFQVENKLIRVANHLPNDANTEAYNEGINQVYLVIVNDEYNTTPEWKISEFCEKGKFDSQYMLITNEEPFDEYCEMILSRFINS